MVSQRSLEAMNSPEERARIELARPVRRSAQVDCARESRQSKTGGLQCSYPRTDASVLRSLNLETSRFPAHVLEPQPPAESMRRVWPEWLRHAARRS